MWLCYEVVYQWAGGKHIKKSPNRLSPLNHSHYTEANKPPRDLNNFLLMNDEKLKSCGNTMLCLDTVAFSWASRISIILMILERAVAKTKDDWDCCFVVFVVWCRLARVQLRSDRGAITSISSRLNLCHVDADANCVQTVVSKEVNHWLFSNVKVFCNCY